MKIISFISPKGGVGKTTLAIHLATSAERDGKKVMILDLDPQGSACFWADLWEKSGRYHMLVDSIQPTRLAKTIEKLEVDFDLCIIDTAGGADDSTLRDASEASDITIMPVRAGAFDLHATMRKKEFIKGNIYAIINAIHPNTSIIAETELSLHEADIKVLCTMTQRQAFVRSISTGMTAYELRKSSKASMEQQNLYDQVNDLI